MLIDVVGINYLNEFNHYLLAQENVVLSNL